MSGAVADRPVSGSTEKSTLINRTVLSIQHHECWYLLSALAVFLLAAVYQSQVKPIWFDEFFTFFISRLSGIPEMLKAMPADGQPPLQYLLTHFSLRCFGETAFALRLPEILAHLGAGLLTWRIVRTHGTAVQALFAMTVLMGATTRSFLSSLAVGDLAFTARPYQLVLLFTALAFFSWQFATMRQYKRLLPLCGITCAIAGGILSHHFAIIQIGTFLAAGEITRLLRRRKLDWPMLAAIGAGLLPAIFTLPLGHQTREVLDQAVRHSSTFCAHPAFSDLLSWLLMVPWLLFLPVTVLAILPVSAPRTSEHESSLPAVPTHEVAAAAALSFIFPLQLILAAVLTGYFQARYAIGGTLGLAILLAWTWPRAGRLRLMAEPALAILTIGYLVLSAGNLATAEIRHPAGRTPPAKTAVPGLLFEAPAGLPIVAANAFEYLPQWWYAPSSLRHRLIYLTDLEYAVQQPNFMPELSLAIDRAFIPFPQADYAAFLASHPHFLLLCTGDPVNDWISARLRRSGWHLSLLAHSGKDQLFRVDRGTLPPNLSPQ